MEFGPIRPPSEAASLLLRLTRNCPWNRCRFCTSYKGRRFGRRTVEEIKQDIKEARTLADRITELSWTGGFAGAVTPEVVESAAQRFGEEGLIIAHWLYRGGENVFLQDANSLVMRTEELVEVLHCLTDHFPRVKRITTYARAKTLARKPVEELAALRQAGLSRVHVGLESGCDSLLEYVDKGVTAAEQIEAGRRAKAAGLSLSEYVILGLGGRALTKEHALDTARVLNAINPDFIRFRTLVITPAMPLYEDLTAGKFVPLSEDEIVEEELLLLEHLEGITSYLASDHALNLLVEVEGSLPSARDNLAAVMHRYLDLPPEERLNFRLGRRIGLYQCLDDLSDSIRHSQVEAVRARLGDATTVESAIWELRSRFI